MPFQYGRPWTCSHGHPAVEVDLTPFVDFGSERQLSFPPAATVGSQGRRTQESPFGCMPCSTARSAVGREPPDREPVLFGPPILMRDRCADERTVSFATT